MSNGQFWVILWVNLQIYSIQHRKYFALFLDIFVRIFVFSDLKIICRSENIFQDLISLFAAFFAALHQILLLTPDDNIDFLSAHHKVAAFHTLDFLEQEGDQTENKLVDQPLLVGNWYDRLAKCKADFCQDLVKI